MEHVKRKSNIFGEHKQRRKDRRLTNTTGKSVHLILIIDLKQKKKQYRKSKARAQLQKLLNQEKDYTKNFTRTIQKPLNHIKTKLNLSICQSKMK